jgi:large repetitive protein
VENELGNQNGVDLANTASFDISTDGQPPFVSDPIVVTVVEPDLEISKTITSTTTNVDAGDTVTYEIIVQHSGVSTSDAFDLNLTDALPPELGSFVIDSATIGALDVSSELAIFGGVLTTPDK